MALRTLGIVLTLSLIACGKGYESPRQESSTAAPAAPTFTAPNTQQAPPPTQSAPTPQPASQPLAQIPQSPPPQASVTPINPIEDPQSPPAQKVPLPKPRPPSEPQSLSALESELLNLLNASRAQKGLPALSFSRTESTGTSECIGSVGHSIHMGKINTMAHDQFPDDICLRTPASGENIGYSTGSDDQAVRTVHQIMMDEGPSGGHYQNIMSEDYNTVGLGFYEADGVLWVTEDFLEL
jgi:uncharacterized protein YkwD